MVNVEFVPKDHRNKDTWGGGFCLLHLTRALPMRIRSLRAGDRLELTKEK
jgi:hypothetical protein